MKSPRVEEIEEVARKHNMDPEVEKGKAYPKTHWDKSGRVLVTKAGRKGAIVTKIAVGIKEMRDVKSKSTRK